MNPLKLGKKYDKIASWWQAKHDSSDYGVRQFEKALSFRDEGGEALDVGCGAGGRFVRILQKRQYKTTGLDVSAKMIKLACDSIFHLPYNLHEPVLAKLCSLLSTDGVLIYTFGDAEGDHEDEWRGEMFYYSSIGVNNNIELLIKNGLSIRHLELDQYPQNHVVVIAKKV